MESQTAVDESQSQAALDEFERRVIEMTHGVKDLLNKQGRKETTALDGSKIELSESQLAELEACRQELEEMKLNILKRESTLHKLGLTFEKLLQK
nr:uncharacterized protein LOC109161763 [Ipomoea batatas]